MEGVEKGLAPTRSHKVGFGCPISVCGSSQAFCGATSAMVTPRGWAGHWDWLLVSLGPELLVCFGPFVH